MYSISVFYKHKFCSKKNKTHNCTHNVHKQELFVFFFYGKIHMPDYLYGTYNISLVYFSSVVLILRDFDWPAKTVEFESAQNWKMRVQRIILVVDYVRIIR